MKSYRLSELPHAEIQSLKARPRIDFSSIFIIVNLVDDVRNRGIPQNLTKSTWRELIEHVSKLPDPQLDSVVKEAFDVAYDNIYAFHLAQKIPEKSVENMEGVRCKRVARSISSVGLYVPGGTAVLPSTALMLSIPAQIAGCKTIVLATPPSQDGSICEVRISYVYVSSGLLEFERGVGGCRDDSETNLPTDFDLCYIAISTMAWGTESCPKVEKIFGPGNQYVTAAKMILQNSEAMISIDMPVGPSKVLVIANKHASPYHIAADSLSQVPNPFLSTIKIRLLKCSILVGHIDRHFSFLCSALDYCVNQWTKLDFVDDKRH
ncbi:histidinol dehydrogenase [Euphorbia peplus]|nr:histidinol dehydrogenase [Euphorbia peplus]